LGLSDIKKWAVALQRNTYTLYLVSKDPRTPLVAKLITAFVVAYALSPIDLIPDFIPILGYLDDLIILPIGIWLAIRLVPDDVWLDCKSRAIGELSALPESRRAAFVVLLVWGLLGAACFYWFLMIL
jgi:uncharacterized membrane protein YkvA (DUF1232 family)